MSKERAGYTVTMFVIDVSPSMGDMRTVELPPGPGGEPRSAQMTNLEWALKYVKLKVQQMIFGGRKTDRCGVVLFGTSETDNPVSDLHGGYDHVTLLLPIHQPTARTLTKLDQIQPSTEIGDFLDGIIVGTFLQNEELGKKASWTRRVVVITDGQNPLEIEEDDIGATVAKLNEWNVELTIVGVDFDDPELPFEEPNKSTIKQKNEEFYSEFVGKIKGGIIGTCEYALQVAMQPDIKVTRSTMMANMLTIGDITNRPEDSIAINIQLAKATSVVHPPPMKKFAKRAVPGGEAGSMESQTLKSGDTQSLTSGLNNQPYIVASLEDVAPLEMRTEYILGSSLKEAAEQAAGAKPRGRYGELDDEDDDGEAAIIPESDAPLETVEQDELVKAYKYGQSWVPIDDDSIDADKLVTIKGLEIVGFVYKSRCKRDWSMGEVYHIFGDKNIPRAQVAFSSLVRAMNAFTRKTEKEISQRGDDDDSVEHDPVLAVIRLVSSDNSPPKMGVALPISTDTIDYMLWVRMPFAEDLRRFVFPSLDIIKDKHGKQRTSHKFIPTAEMERSMDDLVQSSDLREAGPKGDDGKRLPWYSPWEAVHPAVHRLKEAMFHAAITGDMEREPLPPPHPEIIQFFERPKRVIKSSESAVKKCVECFDVRKVPPRVPFHKRKAEAQELADDADVPLTLSDLLGGDAFVSTWKGEDPSEPDQKPSKHASIVVAGKKPKREDSEEETISGDDGEATPAGMRSPAPAAKAQTMIVGEEARDNRIIGNLHPLYDFEQNIARGDIVTKAVADMGKVIPEIVAESFSTQRFDEALDCMKAMRKTALEEDEIDEWNSFLRKFKKTGTQQGFKHPEFWGLVQAVGMSLSLIHDGETASDVKEQESKKFIRH